MKKSSLVIFIILLCSAFAAFLQCTSKKNITETETNKWLNTGDSAKYVGMQTCRKCHEDVYKSFIQTGMGQSFGLANKVKSAADWSKPAYIYDSIKGLYYHPFWNNAKLYVTEFRPKYENVQIPLKFENGKWTYQYIQTAARDTEYSRTEMIDYIIGSGHHTNSHIINTNGYLTQAPFTWFVQQHKWDLPPGFENGYNSRFDRQLGLECISCHNAYPEFVQGSINKYSRVPLGIDCERCHGPGSLHVAQKLTGKVVNVNHDTDFTIVNPRKLPHDLQTDLCQRCHLQGNAILKPGKTWFDFRPATRLSNVMDVFVPVYDNGDNGFLMAAHSERMHKSQCFIQTSKQGVSRELTCITCHNPHISVKVTPEEYFISKCNSCHPSAHKSDPQVLATKGENCISCHMPKSTAVDIPHVTITDHNIRVVKHDLMKTTGVGNFKGLICLTDPNADNVTRAKAYLYFYEKFQHQNYILDSAYKYILRTDPIKEPGLYVYFFYLKNDDQSVIKLASERKKNFPEAITNYQVGQCNLNKGNFEQAVFYLTEAVNQMPYNLDYHERLATAFIFTHHYEEAERNLNFILKENPKFAPAWNALGFVNLAENNLEQAGNYIQKSLQLDPDLMPAKMNLAKFWIAKGELKKAEIEINKILKLSPQNRDALALLNLLQAQ